METDCYDTTYCCGNCEECKFFETLQQKDSVDNQGEEYTVEQYIKDWLDSIEHNDSC